VTAGLMYSIGLVDSLNLNSFYGQHAVYELYTLLLFTIGLLEMRYVMQKLPAPRLTWFYDAYCQHEMRQFWINWSDTVDEASRPFLAVSKEQIDFYLIHKEFVYIKKRSLSHYLEKEKKNLEKHFYDRTISMLKTVENLENSNVKNKIKDVIEDSIKVIMQKVGTEEGRKSLHASGFQSALKGLRTSKMTYENDPLLPLLQNEIQSRLISLKTLSPAEENKMFALTKEQKRQVADSDHRLKIDYLSKAPDVTSASVKNTETYKGIVARMKKR
jgi:hypothetical protein